MAGYGRCGSARLLYFPVVRPPAPRRLPSPCAKFKAKPPDKIPQQVDCLIILRAVFGLGLSMPDPCDQSFRRFDSADAAKQAIDSHASVLPGDSSMFCF